MPCYHPLKGYRSAVVNPSGKRSIVFSPRDGFVDQPVELPCGQCIGCRLERSRQWAIRCVHEASLYERNCFVTLTYDNEHLPKDGSLDVRHFQLFMKRLRKEFSDQRIRFFHCGEYGETFKRPHYHACLFNFDPGDKVLWSVRDGVRLYTSENLSELWSQGFVTVGDVTFESAAYVARYITKKVTGALAESHYVDISPSGEVLAERKPEYITMSRRPGIGKGWYEKYGYATFPSDFVVMRGMKMKPPKFYAGLFELSGGDVKKLKRKRRFLAERFRSDQTWERLLVREEIQRLRFVQLERGYENGRSS